MVRCVMLRCILLLLLPEALFAEEIYTDAKTWAITEKWTDPPQKCPAGYRRDGNSCLKCPPNSYSEVEDAAECIKCSAGLLAGAGSTSASDCKPLEACPGAKVKCLDGLQCIDAWRRCDGKADCKDESDELAEICQGVAVCPDGTTSCSDGITCISVRGKCDGIAYCPDGTDESAEFCAGYTCPKGQEKCGDGLKCINVFQLCDGRTDCSDGSDEIPEFCLGYECPAAKWKCANGLQCVMRTKLCDGKNNCADGSDEVEEVADCSFSEGFDLSSGGGVKKKKGRGRWTGGKGGPDPCLAGDYMTDSGCQKCGENTFSGDGASSCTSCPDGTFSAAGSTSEDACYEKRPTCDCMTPECDYCKSMECAIKQDLISSEEGIIVTSHVTWHSFNTIYLYDEDGKLVSKLQWSMRNIILAGCAKCKTPPALREATKGGDMATWAFSFKDGNFKVKVGGEVLYERQLPKECADIYTRLKVFSFYQMSCENTYSFIPNEMEAGKRMTDCGGGCPPEA